MYLNGIIAIKQSIGLGPTMNLLIKNGKKICKGRRGIASNTNFSFGTPFSISFNGPTTSQAAKPTCKMKRIINKT